MGWGGGGGGGGGISVVGTPAAGDVISRDTANSQYIPRKPGPKVFDITDYGASGRGEIYTTGTVSAGSPTLTLGSATTFAKGQGIALWGAGAAHGLSAPASLVLGVGGTSGATTYEYAVSTGSPDGGWTGVGTSVQVTNGNATLSATNPIYICFPDVSNAGCYYITGRSSTQANRSIIFRKNRATNAYRLTFQAGGYTNAVQSDIGKTVTRGTSTGILVSFDNTNRIWYVSPTIYGTDTFSATGATTIGSGTGAGTTTATAAAHFIKDTGDTSAHTVGEISLARRASTEYWPGDIIVHPLSPTGQAYVCSRVVPIASQYPNTSSTATGSLTLGTTIGTEYQDGDIFWLPIPGTFPVDEPTTAVQNVLLTTISDISGTTVTMAANATTAVTSQVVMHNEWSALRAAVDAADAANPAATSVYIPPGRHNIVLADSENDTFSQWNDVNAGSNVVFKLASSVGKGRTWAFDNEAFLCLMPTCNRAIATDSGDQDFFIRTNGSQAFNLICPSRNGGMIYSPISEPILRGAQDNGWNRFYLYGDFTTGSAQYAASTKIDGLMLFGFTRLASEAQNKGWGFGNRVVNCTLTYGGANSDAMWYGHLAEFDNNFVAGHPYERSICIYTNDSGINDKQHITRNRIFRMGKEGLRLRGGEVIVANNHFEDAKQYITYPESTARVVFANNVVKNGGTVRTAGTAFVWEGNLLTNARLQVAGGTNVSITGGSIVFETSADSYLDTAFSHAMVIEGGTTVVVNGLGITNNESTTAIGRGLGISGGTRVNLNNVHVYSANEAGLEVTSGFAGTLNINGGQYYAGTGPQGHYLCQNASAIVSVSGGAIFRSAGDDDQVYSNNGNLYLRDVVSYCPVNFTSGVDTLEMTDVVVNKGAAGSSTVAAPNAKIADCDFTGTTTISGTDQRVENCNFSTAPTISGATRLYTSENSVAGSKVSSPSALASGANDDYQLPITDTVRISTNAGGSTLTSMAGFASGTRKLLINTTAGDLTMDHAAATGTAANRLTFSTGADIVVSQNESIELIRDVTSTTWRDIGQ